MRKTDNPDTCQVATTSELRSSAGRASTRFRGCTPFLAAPQAPGDHWLRRPKVEDVACIRQHYLDRGAPVSGEQLDAVLQSLVDLATGEGGARPKTRQQASKVFFALLDKVMD